VEVTTFELAKDEQRSFGENLNEFDGIDEQLKDGVASGL